MFLLALDCEAPDLTCNNNVAASFVVNNLVLLARASVPSVPLGLFFVALSVAI